MAHATINKLKAFSNTCQFANFGFNDILIIHRSLDSLHSTRDAINDVPALYFVVPNKENISRMCQVSTLV